ncbi:MAG: Crp/Fnr family transcriptional regulator [Ectothiorhodospiraceae bacterium]
MSNEPIRDVLARNRLFRPLASSAVDLLANQARRQSLANGDILFHFDDPAASFFLLETGLIKLVRTNEAGQEKVIHVVNPGEAFAEAVMFMDHQCYPVTAEAIAPGSVIAVPNGAYRAILRASPEACMALLADLSMRLHTHVQEIDELTLRQSRPRVVRYLLSQTPKQVTTGTSLELPAPKHVVASRLAITPETLSRILHELESSGVVRVNQRVIQVLDAEALRAKAD